MLILTLKIIFVLIVVVAGIAVFASGTAIESLVNRGFLPKFCLRLVPALTVLARTIAAALILIGAALAAIRAGWLPPEWLYRYGWAGLLIFLGVFLLLVTLRRRPSV
ncbi:MAG TPA: hypothetical protein VGF06_07365 [Terriglobales bacterium]|jgi:hypothetical protein